LKISLLLAVFEPDSLCHCLGLAPQSRTRFRLIQKIELRRQRRSIVDRNGANQR
jgi:hypothetical protein